MLNYNKRASLATLVESAEKDSKKLFRIVNSLLGRKEENHHATKERWIVN